MYICTCIWTDACTVSSGTILTTSHVVRAGSWISDDGIGCYCLSIFSLLALWDQEVEKHEHRSGSIKLQNLMFNVHGW